MREWIERAKGLSFGVTTGFRASDGRFEQVQNGHRWMMFEEDGDTVFWSPFNNQIATWEGRAFALNEQAILRATTYSFGDSLIIHASVSKWILAGGKGIFVLDWRRAFDNLRFAPRIACDEAVSHHYRTHMRPQRMPVMTVRTQRRGVAA